MRQIRRDLTLAQRETSTDQSMPSCSGEWPLGSLSIVHDSNLDCGKLEGKPRGYFMSQPRSSNAFDTPTLEEMERVIWCSGNRKQRFMIETSGRGRDTSEAVAPRDSLMRLETGQIVSADDCDKGRMECCSEREIDCLADGSCYRMSSSSHHVCLPVLGETFSTPEVNSCSSNSSRDEFEDVETGNETGTVAARCRRAAHVAKIDGNPLLTAETDAEAAVKTFRRNKRGNDGPRGRSSPVPRGVNEGCFGKPGGSVTVVAPNVRDILVSGEELLF